MASLDGVDSNGVSQEVIDTVERFRAEHHEEPADDTTDAGERYMLTFDMAVSQRDAEYIVECLQVLLQEQRISERLILCLIHDEISDEAVEIFCGFLRESQCHLVGLILFHLPRQQIRRLLAALRTNRSVKDLSIHNLQHNEGALWIADLLRHKRDFTDLQLRHCCFPFTQILHLLRGQSNLKALILVVCRISSDILLFNDPESTQLFVDNILLSPFTRLKRLILASCGVFLENRPLMAGIHKNTTIVEFGTEHADAATRPFIGPILRRNSYLGHVHEMLGTRTMTMLLPSSSTFPAGVGEIVIAPTIPPPCGLWATVLAKVGQGTQGASPVFTILQDRLATWMIPPSSQQLLQHENQNNRVREEEEEESVHDVREEYLLQAPSPASNIVVNAAISDGSVAAAARLVGARPPVFENETVPTSTSLLRVGAARIRLSGDEDCGSINVVTSSTATTSTSIGRKRGAPTTSSDNTAGIKMPKSDVF